MKKSTKKNQDDNTTGKKNSPHSSDTSPLNKGNSQAKGVTLPKKWDKLKVLGEIIKLAEREREREREQRPRKSRVTIELKQLSLDSGWDMRYVKEIYESTIEDFDADAELPDDEKEFSEILSANVKLKCHAMLPQELHPVLTFADNLGVPYEPTLVALEAAAASLIDPDTKIIGRECSNYDQNATIFSALERDTEQAVTTLTDTSQRVSKIVDDLRNCDREIFMKLCEKYGKDERQQACQILESSNDEEDKKQFQKIKFWAYERQLGGELKVGYLIKLKGGDDSSFNTWEIKSVESNHLWVERTGYKVKPETRRVKFSNVEQIYTTS